MGIVNIICFIQIALIPITEVNCFQVSLNANIGSLKGLSDNVTFNGETKSVSRFLGIPFAKPPVGERRFRRPEIYGTLTSPYNATYFRPHCMQRAAVNPSIQYFKMDEDCLYLNVFVPGNIDLHDNSKKYAVMVFIHGGGFIFGGSDIYPGDVLSAFYNIIVVTINYRLNTFGFLSNGTTSSGNFGLWDQKLALHWVHDNIADFGGDPEKVTLFGNSAGAASVLYQVMNPTNKGLFQRILTQSGSVLAQWAQQYNPAEMFKNFVSEVKCDKESYNDVLVCLQSKDAADLVTTRFGPVVDRDFIIEDPLAIFSKVGTNRPASLDFFFEVDFLSGVQSQDGSVGINTFISDFKEYGVNFVDGVPRNIFDNKFVPSVVSQMYGTTDLPALKQSIIQQYIDWSRPDDDKVIREKIVEFWSDVAFFVPAINVLKSHRTFRNANKTSYFYVFEHQPPFDFTYTWLKGAKHALELAYVFGFPDVMKVAVGLPPNFPLTFPPNEIKLSSIIMTQWSNFAKTGDPNLPGGTDIQGLPDWPQYDANSQLYLEFSPSISSDSVKGFFAGSRVEFWTNSVPLLKKCETCEKKCPDSQETSRAHSPSKYTIVYLCLLFVEIFQRMERFL